MPRILFAVVVLMSLEASNIRAEEPILVLVSRSAAVSSGQALSVLPQINELMIKSGLSNLRFENAGNHGAQRTLHLYGDVVGAGAQTR